MTVTIGIKALNEEAHIAAALESAIAAAAPLGGEVVLADSGSTDRTIAIARRYPEVRIVQLANYADRSCGAGAQLAYQAAQMRYFYLLDGDMVLAPDFLAAALAFLEANPDHAGVGGEVREVETANLEFVLRASTAEKHKAQGGAFDVDRLDCGGLYRMEAIASVGYFADRNLHAFEEFELGARLRAAGWRLARIDVAAVDHFGHSMRSAALLWRRLRTGYAGAPGEVVRAALGRPHWPIVARRFSHLRHGLIVILWWFLLAAAVGGGSPTGMALLLILPVLFLWWRRGRIGLAFYSLLNWNVAALGLIQGLARRRAPPERLLAMRFLDEA